MRVMAASVIGLLLSGAVLNAEDPAPAASPWDDVATRERIYAEALDAVEEECGAKFAKRPTLRASTPEEVQAVIAADLAPLAGLLGTDGQGLSTLAEAWSHATMALYDDDAHVVHLVPANVVEAHRQIGASEPLGEAELRLLFVHEGTHALDWERFGIEAKFHAATQAEHLRAFGAVTEGHAQLIAERVATRRGESAAFDRLTRCITAPPADVPQEARARAAAAAAFWAFAYEQGLVFMRAVHEARGRAGVEAALTEPPTDVGLIEAPRRYLGTDRSARPNLKALLQVLEPLVGGDGWVRNESHLPRAMLDSLAAKVPASHRDRFLEGFREGRVLAARHEEGGAVLVLALSYESAAQADHFLEAERLSAKEDSGTQVDGTGAGKDDALPGHHLRAVRQVDGEDQVVEKQAARLGTVALALMIKGAPWLDRATQDAALARADLVLRDPAAAAAAPPLAVPPIVSTRRKLHLRVEDPEGRPVPQAQVRVRLGEYRSASGEVKDGAYDLTLRGKFDPPRVSVYDARDAEGRPLGSAPAMDHEVPAPAPGEKDVALTLRLEPGVEIAGRVVAPEGADPSAVEVVAVPERDGRDTWWLRVEVARARPEADGSFRLLGLAASAYRLRLVRGEERASLEETKARGGERDVVLTLRPPTSVTIAVTDERGDPVVGARIDAFSWTPAASAVPNGTSDRQGLVRIKGLDPEGEASLEVTPPAQRRDLAILRVRGWKPADDTLVLGPGWTLQGLIRDEQGRPAKARITLRLDDHGSTSRPVEPDGSFELHHLPAGPVQVRAEVLREDGRDVASGFEGERAWTTVAQGQRADLTLAADQQGVTLRVLDPAGRPVPQAEVSVVYESGGTTSTMEDGELLFVPPGGPYDVYVVQARDADGRQLPLAPGAIRSSRVRTGTLELQLEQGRRIAGRVRGPSDEPLEGVEVTAEAVERSVGLGATMSRKHGGVRSGADGRFELLTLDDGTYELSVEPPGGFAEPPPVRAQAGGNEVTLRLAAAAPFAVLVVDPAGRPVAGARIVVKRWVREADGRNFQRTHGEPLRTGLDGRVHVEGLGPDEVLRLDVEPPADRPDLCAVGTTAVVRSSEERITLPAGFVVTGRVVDEDGEPVAGARVYCDEHADPWDAVATSEADGTFRTKPLPAPQAKLTAQAYDDVSRMQRDAPEVTVAAEAPSATLVLPVIGTTLRIQVADARGPRPLWLLGPVEGTAPQRVEHVLGADGRLRLPDLAPGTYRYWIPPTADDARTAYRQVVVPTPQPQAPVLAPALALRVRLRVPEGTRNATVAVLGPFGDPIAAQETAPALYEARGLPAGRWKVRVQAQGPSGPLEALEPADVGDEQEIEIELQAR